MSDLTVSKTVYKPVTCERCGCAYGYRFTATGEATERGYGDSFTSSILEIAERDVADSKLHDAAYQDAYKKLNSTHRFVACPRCRWYQRKMSRYYGREQLKRFYYLAKGLLTLAAVAGGWLVISFIDSPVSHHSRTDRNEGDIWRTLHWTWGLTAVILGGVGWWLLHTLDRRAEGYDLNANYPNHVAPFPGEPEAIISRQSNPYLNDGIADDHIGWHVARNGKQSAPMSWNQLFDLAFASKVNGDDYILAPGAAEWMQARSIEELGLK